jgi:hypothetical protein
MDDATREETMRHDIRDAVNVNDDDALASLVEQLRELRFVEVRRVLDGLDPHEVRRVAETAIFLPLS